MVKNALGVVLGAVVAFVGMGSALADDSQHWHWKYDDGGSYAADPVVTESFWHPYCDAANWTVGTTGLNPGSRWPTESDLIYYGIGYHGMFCFDMGGNSVTFYGIDDTYTRTQYPSSGGQWGWHNMLVRNGTLTVGNCLTNTRTHFNVWSGGNVVLSDNCRSRLGLQGAATHWYVHDDAYAKIGGNIEFNAFAVDVFAGGEVVLDCSRFEHLQNNAVSYINNSGSLSFPSGWALSGTASYGTVITTQLDGQLTIGGNLSKAAAAYRAELVLAGGSVQFTGNSELINYSDAVISNLAPLTVTVATGKTADYRIARVLSGAVLTKDGGGEFIIGTGSPQTVTVSAGTLGVAGEFAFGSSLSLASGTTLRFYGNGASATSISGLSGATVDVSSSISDGTRVFSSTDSTLRSAVLAKLQSSSSSIGTFSVSGNDIVFSRSHEPTIFYWKGGFSTWKNFNDADNWGVGTDASATNPNKLIPGPNDWMEYLHDYSFTAYWDLQGLNHSIKGFDHSTWLPKGTKWGFHKYLLRNGTLEITQNFTNQRITVSLESNAKFILGPKCSTRMSQGDAQSWYTVKDGCEMIMGGYLQLVIPMIEVMSGGTLSFEPVELTATTDFKTVSGHPDAYIRNRGTMNFPNGFHFLGGNNASNPGTLTFDSLGGVMTFDGSITKTDSADGVFNFLFDGGTVVFNESTDLSWFAMVGSTNANDATTIDVASGKSLRLPGGTFVAGSKLIKRGNGVIVFDSGLPEQLDVKVGDLQLAGTGAVLDNLTMASGSTLTISGVGNSINEFSTYSGINFVVDVAKMSVGSVVLKSTNNTMLKALKDKASLPTGYYLAWSSGRLTLSNDSIGYVFRCLGEKSMSDPTGWTSGTVAPAGADVFVKGETTTAVLDDTMNVYNSITVLDGGTLKLKNLSTVPSVNLMYSASLKLAEGQNFVFSLGQVACEADAENIPIWEVAAGAKVAFASGMEFKNVDLRLYGAVDLNAPAFLGTAESGELSYFNFAATNATIQVLGASYSSKPIYWMAPKNASGRVRSPRGISMQKVSISAGGVLFGNHIGYYSETSRNPDDEKFDVILDATSFPILYNSKNVITSGAQIKVLRGGAIEKHPKIVSAPGTYGHHFFEGAAQLTFEGDGSWLGYYFDRYCLEDKPVTDGLKRMTFANGSSLRIHHFTGNGKAIYTFKNGFFDALELPGYDRAFWGGWVKSGGVYKKYTTGQSPGTDIPEYAIIEHADLWKYISPAFRGLKAVEVPSGYTLGFRGVNWLGLVVEQHVPNSTVNPTDATPKETYSNEWDRVIYVDSKVPITGGGSIYVCNTVSNHTMTAVICCSNNTATGKAWAEEDKVGNGNQLLFNDGANWAGTVVSNGRLGLVNTNAALRVAKVSFANIQFDQPMPIRVWPDASDCIRITSGGFTPMAGCLSPVLMDGYLPAVGDTFTIAELPYAVKSMAGRTYLSNHRWLLVDEVDADNVRRLKLRYAPGGILLNFRGAVPTEN